MKALRFLPFLISILILFSCATQSDLMREEFTTTYCFTAGVYNEDRPTLPEDLKLMLNIQDKADYPFIFSVSYTEEGSKIEKLYYGNFILEDGRNAFFYDMHTQVVFSVTREINIVDNTIVSDNAVDGSPLRTLHSINQDRRTLRFGNVNEMGDFSEYRIVPLPKDMIPTKDDINAQGILPYIQELHFYYSEKLSNY